MLYARLMTSAASPLPTMAFGATGHVSSRVIFGAAAFGTMRQDKADGVLATLLEYGVNHIDTAADYGDSEQRIGPWMADHRGDFFLATKTGDRSGSDARASLERSLERLQTDHVDLIQLHNLVEEDEWQQALGPDGAVAALFRARDEGLCRFVGVTGHGTRIARMHIRSLGEADFDSVLFPYNHALMELDFYAHDVAELLALCADRNVAVQTIKSVARRRWTDGSTRHFSWYEPVEDEAVLERAVHYVLANPQVFLNSSSDTRILRSILDAACSFDGTAPREAHLAADRAAESMTPLFDGASLERI